MNVPFHADGREAPYQLRAFVDYNGGHFTTTVRELDGTWVCFNANHNDGVAQVVDAPTASGKPFIHRSGYNPLLALYARV